MPLRFLITGATGFVGSHVADALCKRNLPVRAIARGTSDTSFLDRLGIPLLRGELTDAAFIRKALDETDIVIHCAAKVGDTGPIEDYRAANVETLRTMLEACKGRELERFVHMSSLGVYAARHHYGTDESEPLPDNHIDSYTRSKVEADRLAIHYERNFGVPVVVLRPGFVYGPRDNIVLPRIIRRMRTSKIHYLGGDQRALNTIFIDNLVDAVFLAASNPDAIGQAYNLTDGELVTKRQFIEAVADGMNLPKSTQLLPRWFANLLTKLLWFHIRRRASRGLKPVMTAAQYKFLILNLDFSIEKAKRELGYRPATNFEQGMRQTLTWYHHHPEVIDSAV